MIVRTGYSFRTAVGHLEDVAGRLNEIGWKYGPITDRCSTFGFNRWTKICDKHALTPIYGVELAVAVELGAKKPTLDYWTFLAVDDIKALHDLIWLATSNPGREPSLTYDQAENAEGVVKIAGPRCQINLLSGDELVFLGLSPATPRGLVRKWIANDWPLLAVPNNYFPRDKDREFYRVTLGRFADNQSYPQHILSDDEWYLAMDWLENVACVSAVNNRDAQLKGSRATLKKATLLKPERPSSLLDMCHEGAKRLGVDLCNQVYAERLKKELDLIAEKQFEDYFYIIADMMAWSRQKMVVGPARGSSCGSLVCYLLGITSIDPLPYKLIFERFIDMNRGGWFLDPKLEERCKSFIQLNT
jgi:DNA polymerase III alpha subunit